MWNDEDIFAILSRDTTEHTVKSLIFLLVYIQHIGVKDLKKMERGRIVALCNISHSYKSAPQ